MSFNASPNLPLAIDGVSVIEPTIRSHATDSFYDGRNSHGPITGSGPGFERAMSKFRARMRDTGEPGRWIEGVQRTRTTWKRNRGNYTDCNYMILAGITEWTKSARPRPKVGNRV